MKLTASAISAVRLSGFSSRHLLGQRRAELVSEVDTAPISTPGAKPSFRTQRYVPTPSVKVRGILYGWVINKVTVLRKRNISAAKEPARVPQIKPKAEERMEPVISRLTPNLRVSS